ncbi:MAG: NAD(+) synthase [Deltaproteobacteria bacterium RBG_13_52_11b]|nr:MAG: NAD(+) synthase [Deltaproteobacteria bacterium RBG_13_52_11b]
MEFTKDILKIGCKSEAERISIFIKEQMLSMHREGIVIGLSGGVDSALCAALSVRVIGKDRVLGLLLPDRESSPQSAELAAKHANQLGIKTMTVDITPVLEAFGTYEKRDAVAKAIYPEFGAGHKLKITLPSDILNKDSLNFFTLTTVDPNEVTKSTRLNNEQARGIIAATCTKHRIRMMAQYYFAEKSNYLVCGTTNRSEAVQGLFVKYGDGGVDIEPIAHLYKNQVFQLAEYLGIIKEILERLPAPDTYSAPVTDEEWYFRMPLKQLDLLLYAWENRVDISEVCRVMELTEEQVKRVFRDFTNKYNATRHLIRMPPTLQ